MARNSQTAEDEKDKENSIKKSGDSQEKSRKHEE